MELITDIRPCKRFRNRYDLYLDDEYFYTVNKKTMESMQLIAGTALQDRDAFKLSCYDGELKYAIDTTLRYLSQPRTRQEALNKLHQMQYDQRIACEVLRRMEEWGYINDGQYMQDYVSHYTKAGYGRYAIVRKLEQKGIQCTVSQWDEFNSALAYAKKKLSRQNGSQALNRTARAMFQRGFSSETIRKVLRQLGDMEYEE
ncbi:MAG: regulatory protein RecX [Christensenellales bacterium]